MIAVLDYDVGKVDPVTNMLRRLGHDCTITADVEVIKRASLILMTKRPNRCLESLAWAPSNREFVLRRSKELNVSLARDSTESGVGFAISLINRKALDGFRRRHWSNFQLASVALGELHSMVRGAGCHC